MNMKNKKVKTLISCICAGSLLLGAIPTNGIVASATDTTAEVEDGITFCDTAGNELDDLEDCVHGVTYDNDEGIFVRMPEDNAAEIYKERFGKDSVPSIWNNGKWKQTVYSLVREAAGGRLRFNTDSPTITIKAELYLHDLEHYKHGMKMEAAKYGFDVYVDTADGSTLAGTVQGDAPSLVRDVDDTDGDGNKTEAIGIESNTVIVNETIHLGETKERDITIYFPIMIETKKIEIIVENGSTVQEHQKGYEGNGKIVIYGNSITQGGSATNPGSNYVNTAMRNLNRDYTNLGVWGNAKGETKFAEYIANMEDISMLIMDYDGNESKASELEARHYNFYQTVRSLHQDIPIVLLTRSGNRLQVRNAEDPSDASTTDEMRSVIRQTYEKAKAAGDENVHYIDGETFFRFSYAYLTDGVHPDSVGHANMATVVTAALKEVLAGTKNVCVEPSSCVQLASAWEEDFAEVEDGTIQPTGVKVGKSKISDTGQECYVVTQTDGNKAYQMKFVKGQDGAVVSLSPSTSTQVWSGEDNLAVELDAKLYVIDNVIPSLGVRIGESPNNSADQKYEVRIEVTAEGYTISLYDGTTGSASRVGDPTTVAAQDFIQMYQEGEIAFNLKITQTPVKREGVDTYDIDVYVNGMLAAGYVLSPAEGFEPNSFKVLCYGIGTNGVSVSRALIDNLKAYVIPTHQLSRITTEGMREHYVCNECGKKFLDEKGILQVTDADLIITNDCMEMLFSEDFEGADSWKLDKKYTGTDPVGIVAVDDGHAYQLGVTRESNAQYTYITKSSSALATAEKYTIRFESTLYRGTLDDGTSAGNRWPTLTFMMYDTSTTGYFEIRIIPKSTGFQTYLKEKQGSDSYEHSTTTVEDSTLAVSSSKTEVSYDVRIDVTTYKDDNNNTRWQFLLYVGDNDAVHFDFEPYYEGIAINQLRFYTYPSTVKQTTHFKTQIDNIMIYTDSHTLSPVEATPSTSDKAGQRAHYACEVCGKKFADSKGEQAVTDAQLAYAKLTDILCQTKPNDNNSDNTDIRFVVYVDDYQKYQNVTFKITCSAGTGTAVCKDVYTGVYAGGVLYTAEDIYGVDGYFATFILKNNSQTDLEDTMSVVATWTAIDGTETTKTRIVNISEEQE